jgi:hypothetical protein
MRCIGEWGHTLYHVMEIIFVLFLPITVNLDHLPAPVLSLPDLCIRWVHQSNAIVTVPPILKDVPSMISLEELNKCLDDVAIGYCSFYE